METVEKQLETIKRQAEQINKQNIEISDKTRSIKRFQGDPNDVQQTHVFTHIQFENSRESCKRG